MATIRVRGHALPDGEVVDLYADGDRWTTDPVPNAELAADGWLLPGLVDAHTHPGAEAPGDPLDHDLLRADLGRHLDAGVTLVRSPGLAGEPPAWFGVDEGLPRAVHAGPWIARHGQFFDGWGRRAAPEQFPDVAAEQAARTGWAKLIGDWQFGDPALPTDIVAATVRAVHAVGGRVAVHSQQADGGSAAVAAGVDSVEHGQGLDPALLDLMAAQGTALTPTLVAILSSWELVEASPPSARRERYLATAGRHGSLAVAAVEAGVTVLAGTDSRPHGRVADEIRALAAAGMRPHDALGAGSWAARAYLGWGGLEPGAAADVVVYAGDPRADLGMLDHPLAVVLRGRRVR